MTPAALAVRVWLAAPSAALAAAARRSTVAGVDAFDDEKPTRDLSAGEPDESRCSRSDARAAATRGAALGSGAIAEATAFAGGVGTAMPGAGSIRRVGCSWANLRATADSSR